MKMKMNLEQRAPWPQIVFFDGICILCNRSVSFLVRNDRAKKLKYSALQSELGMDLFPGLAGSDMKTVLFLKEGTMYKKSDAVIRILIELGFPYNLSASFLLIPGFIRDGLYDLVARNRFKWFGKRDMCRLKDHRIIARLI